MNQEFKYYNHICLCEEGDTMFNKGIKYVSTKKGNLFKYDYGKFYRSNALLIEKSLNHHLFKVKDYIAIRPNCSESYICKN